MNAGKAGRSVKSVMCFRFQIPSLDDVAEMVQGNYLYSFSSFESVFHLRVSHLTGCNWSGTHSVFG